MDTLIAPPAVGDAWYRYEDKAYSVTVDADRELYSTRYEMEELVYQVYKITAKGVWIAPRWAIRHGAPGDTQLVVQGSQHFVRLAARRRFAHPTKKQALESYIARKEAQIQHLSRKLDRAQLMRHRAKAELQRMTGAQSEELTFA